jgi:hypothetical protein
MVTDQERRAFLIAKLCYDDGYRHPTYIYEQIDLAFAARSVNHLRGSLDSERLARFDKILSES